MKNNRDIETFQIGTNTPLFFEKTYSEIAQIMGSQKTNVANQTQPIKKNLSKTNF